MNLFPRRKRKAEAGDEREKERTCLGYQNIIKIIPLTF
jgi:hypothetical protein